MCYQCKLKNDEHAVEEVSSRDTGETRNEDALLYDFETRIN